jgi:predicted restriction endonuclease
MPKRGARGKRQAGPDARWHAAVLARFGGRCGLCGGKAHCGHHIDGKQANPRRRHDVSNGIAVCSLGPANCHDWIHRHPKEAAVKIAEIMERMER